MTLMRDCNGLADDDDDSVTGAFAYYGDSDNDGFGNEDIKLLVVTVVLHLDL